MIHALIQLSGGMDKPFMSKLATGLGQMWRWANLHEGGQPKRKSYDDKTHGENCRVKMLAVGRSKHRRTSKQCTVPPRRNIGQVLVAKSCLVRALFRAAQQVWPWLTHNRSRSITEDACHEYSQSFVHSRN